MKSLYSIGLFKQHSIVNSFEVLIRSGILEDRSQAEAAYYILVCNL